MPHRASDDLPPKADEGAPSKEGGDAPPPANAADAPAKKKKSKWDDQGDGTNTVPEWLKDLMPKGDPQPPPGIKPENFKVLQMDAAQIRALIGRGGETVQGIRAKSGAEVKIDHLPSEPIGRVTVIGDVEKTEGMIKEALTAKGCPLGGPGPPGLAGLPLPPGVPGLPGAGLPGLPALPAGTPATVGTLPGAMSPANAPPTGPVETRELAIPAELVGGMIGPGGATINDLRKQSGVGVQIAILPAVVPGGQQNARISGAPPAIDHAEKLVRTKLEDLMQARKPTLPSILGQSGLRPPTIAPPAQLALPGLGGLSGATPRPGFPPALSPRGPQLAGASGPVESREIPIPAELIGGMIGPGGATINELRKQAGHAVLIAIVPGNVPAAQGGQQLARISGSAAAVNMAEALVRAKLLELSQATRPVSAIAPGLAKAGPGLVPRPIATGLPQPGGLGLPGASMLRGGAPKSSAVVGTTGLMQPSLAPRPRGGIGPVLGSKFPAPLPPDGIGLGGGPGGLPLSTLPPGIRGPPPGGSFPGGPPFPGELASTGVSAKSMLGGPPMDMPKVGGQGVVVAPRPKFSPHAFNNDMPGGCGDGPWTGPGGGMGNGPSWPADGPGAGGPPPMQPWDGGGCGGGCGGGDASWNPSGGPDSWGGDGGWGSGNNAWGDAGGGPPGGGGPGAWSAGGGVLE